MTEFDPFGIADGTLGDFDEIRGDLVQMPERFGGIARDPGDARVRVLVGPLGSGKSLLLRRMQENRRHFDSTITSDIQRNDDLLTSLVLKFSRKMDQSTSNTEYWTLLWRRAILRAAWSFIKTQSPYNHPTEPQARAALERLQHYERLLGQPDWIRRASSQAARIIREFDGKQAFIDYLIDERWDDIEGFLGTVLNYSPELFIYVDDIDRNYAWAPGPWTQCQRGLFYAVMHLARGSDSPLRNKVHVVVALRDVTLATVVAGEGGPRYVDQTHINHLRWGRDAAAEFLRLKVARLPSDYFDDPRHRSVESWLGLGSIQNSRPGSEPEGIEGYLIRHTRLVPRDIVLLGNDICAYQRRVGRRRLTDEELRRLIGEASRRNIRSQLNVCASMMLEETAEELAVNYDVDSSEEVLEKHFGDKVIAIVDLIERVGQEVFTAKKRAFMDVSAQRTFGTQARLSTALWRNRLLGWVDSDDRVHFFEPLDFYGRSQLPIGQGVRRYAWHCMVHDIARGVAINGPTPYHPE